MSDRLSMSAKYSPRRLLETGAAPKLVADQCGFSDVDTFRRAFQRKIGVTPAAYRRVQVDEAQTVT